MSDVASHSINILNLVNKTVELPTIPEVLVKLNDVMADPDASADHVADVISKDPAVSTNMLRIVNSAYYGLQVRVSSISLAVSVMGFNMTRKVALKAAVFSVFGKKNEVEIPQFDPSAFWKHAIYVGTACRVIGQNAPRFAASHPEDLYVTGLLHDIGKIILLEKSPKDYLPILQEAAATGRPETEVEQEALGFNHADVGSVLAIKWFLPEDLTIAIRYHHQPSKDPFHQSLSSLVHLADHLGWSAGYPSTQGTVASEMDTSIYEQVGLDAEALEDLLPQVQEDFGGNEMPF